LIWQTLSSSLALRGVPNPAIRTTLRLPLMGCASLTIKDEQTNGLPFTTHPLNDAIDVFDLIPIRRHAGALQGQVLRPASRDLSGSARSGNAHQHVVRDDRKHQNPQLLADPKFQWFKPSTTNMS